MPDHVQEIVVVLGRILTGPILEVCLEVFPHLRLPLLPRLLPLAVVIDRGGHPAFVANAALAGPHLAWPLIEML